jgi:HEPN domain-containing protein
MSVEKRVRAFLELASKDTEAADLLLAGGNRYSAYHVQQAVEKLTKALLLARGIEAGVEHRLEELHCRSLSFCNPAGQTNLSGIALGRR